MAADYEAFHLVGVGAQSLAKIEFEAAGVERATHTDNAVFGQTGDTVDEVSHRVHGVGYADDYGVGAVGQHAFGHLFNDAGVYADELFACHTRFAGKAGGDDHHVGVGSFGVVVCHADYAGVHVQKVCCLHHIHGFAFGYAFFNIDHYYFVGHAAHGHDVSCGCAYVAGAYNCYF